MHLISLSFTEFSNEVERTNKKAIIAVVTMMCIRKRNHQAKPSFRGKLPSLYGIVGLHAIIYRPSVLYNV